MLTSITATTTMSQCFRFHSCCAFSDKKSERGRARESEVQPARERQRTLSQTHSSFLSHFVPCSKAVVVRRNDAHDTTTNGSAREVRVRKVSVQNLFIGITSRHAALPYADGVVICTLIGHWQCQAQQQRQSALSGNYYYNYNYYRGSATSTTTTQHNTTKAKHNKSSMSAAALSLLTTAFNREFIKE